MVLDVSFISGSLQRSARAAFSAVAHIGVACPVAIVHHRSSEPHEPILSEGLLSDRVFKEGLSTLITTSRNNQRKYNIPTSVAEKLRAGDVFIGVVAPFNNKKTGMVNRTLHPVLKIKSEL